MVCGQFPECVKYPEGTLPCLDVRREKACIVSRGVSRPSCRERGKSYTLNMKGSGLEAVVYQIDGGVITGADEKKCDNAIVIRGGQGDKGKAVLVELKGKHITEALGQLNGVLNLDIMKEVARSCKLYGRIVHRSSPPKISAAEALYRRLRERFSRAGGNLKQCEIRFEETYAELDQGRR